MGPRAERFQDVFDNVRAGSKSICSSSILPASILEKSRMSLMMVSKGIGGLRTDSARYSRCSAVSPCPAQFGHADDAIHGGADLMAHVGQELRFQAGIFEGLVAGESQLLFHPHAFLNFTA